MVPPAAPAPAGSVIDNIRSTIPWLKVMGVVNVVGGGLGVLTVWGVIFAWLPIWLGIVLLKTARQAEAWTRNGDPAGMESLTRWLRTCFFVGSIAAIVGLVLAALGTVTATVIGLGFGRWLLHWRGR
uniref:DUF5362 domain-containing protein n=1 Tax=candidate division WOR-3 bacterium TaxID=2052148 RepID=A0A7C4GG60_UNCW3